LFDGPDPATMVEVRSVSMGPAQALFFMNDPLAVDAASGAAQYASEPSAPTDDAKITRLYRLILTRDPTDTERRLAGEFIKSAREESANGKANDKLVWQDLSQLLLASNEFVFID